MVVEKLRSNSEAEQLVVSFLKGHPGFFREHPELLAWLAIPHETGEGVSSLIERQVEFLRNRIKQLEGEIKGREARTDRLCLLLTEMSRLSNRLISRERPTEIYLELSEYLKKYHACEHLRLFVFSDFYREEKTGGVYFMGSSSALKRMFIEIINRNKTLCGSLQEEHIKVLFQRQAADIHSTLIIPIVQSYCEGLLVLGSTKRGLYGRGPELDMLVHLASMVSVRLNDLIIQSIA